MLERGKVRNRYSISNSLQLDVICDAIISTVVFDRKDCYDAEHDLLATAKFLFFRY